MSSNSTPNVDLFDLVEYHSPLSELVLNAADATDIDQKSKKVIAMLSNPFLSLPEPALAKVLWCALTHQSGVEDFMSLLTGCDIDAKVDGMFSYHIIQTQCCQCL